MTKHFPQANRFGTKHLAQALLPVLLAASLFAMLGGTTQALAQTSAADPAQIRRQIELERERKLQESTQESTQGLNKNQLLDPSQGERPGQSIDESAFRIHSWLLRGVRLVSETQLQALLSPYVGRDLGLTQLQAIARLIERHYREQGFLARAVIPSQDITQGQIRIEVIEAKLGDIYLEGLRDEALAKRIRSLLLAHQPLDEPLRFQALERALALINELPGVSVIASLSPGFAHQETHLTLKSIASDDALHDLELGIDNFGARATGRMRKSLLWAWNRPLSWGDQLHLQALHSAGTRYARLSYSLPLTNEGTRLSAIASALNYEVLQGDFTALSPTGQSQSVGFELRQALWRRAQYRIDVTGSVEQKRFEQSVQGLDTTERRLTSRQLSLESQLTDQWLKGPQLSAEAIALNTLQLSAVQTDIHTIADSAQTTRLWRWSLSRSQPLWSAAAQAVDTRLLLHASGQRSAQNLDSAEKFYVGGSSGVRAFPASEGFASNGHMLNAELRMQFSPSFSVGFMRDRASVWEHEQTRYRYQGYGIQWSWRITPQTQMRFVLARRDKANPLPNPITGTDRDGSLERDRMWLSINGVLR